MDWYKTAKVKKLQAKWYEKLKKKGFEDIEYDETHLRQHSTNFTKNEPSWSSPAVVQAKLAYYSMARSFLLTHKFKNKLERSIFALHSEGIGIRVIATEVGTYKQKVQATLQRLVKIMKGPK